MNNLSKKSLIKIENLDEQYYFQSILQEAYKMKQITDSELENIQLQIIQLIAKRTERYTSGASSSVKIETAQNIMESIFYNISIYLKTFSDVDIAITILKETPLLELYKNGDMLIKKKIKCTKKLLDLVKKNIVHTNNYAYNETIKTGIDFFFPSYDIEFSSHETPCIIDYPLSIDKMNLTGIEYIYDYLKKLFLENQFCGKFSFENINCVLKNYYRNYQELLINIFKCVLTNALGCTLLNKNIYELNIEPLERQYLQDKLENLSKIELNILLNDISIQMCKELNISNRVIQKYIIETVKNISIDIKNALKNHNLQSLFISFKEDYSQSIIQFDSKEKMDDELFRKIVDELAQCSYVPDKIAIIKKIDSLADLIDIFEADCIFDDEFTQIFELLGDMELAVISKELSENTKNEKSWCSELRIFLNTIDLSRAENIKHLCEKITPPFFNF